ncbi:MAG: hypothetical protein ACNA77_00010 [Opitutales bacterium]
MRNKIKMNLSVSAAALAGCLLLGTAQPVDAASGSHWDTVVFDPNALGSIYITSRASSRRSPNQAVDNQIARYNVSFDRAGNYELYARLKLAAEGSNGGMYYSSNLDMEDHWLGVETHELNHENFAWVNLSKMRRGHTFTVESPGTALFSIASQRQGIHIDAFAFATAETSFTDDQLDAAAVGTDSQPGLIGFQAEFAAVFGSNTISDEGLALKKTITANLLLLREQLAQQIPVINQASIAAWQESIQAEEVFAQEAASTANAVASMQAAEGNLERLEEEHRLGPRTLEDARDRLTLARARGEDDPEMASAIENAESFLANRQRQINRLERSIDRAKRAVATAEEKLPEAIRAAAAAKQAHERAMAATWRAMDALGTGGILGSNRLDGMLAQYQIIRAVSPRELAKFAVQSPENSERIQQLFADTGLMVQMLIADGPNGNKYGEAVKIYNDIQQASPRAKEGVLRRLALAISLGHATPVSRRERDISTGSVDDEAFDESTLNSDDLSRFIDPVERFLNYEKWYLAGELDPGFKDLCAWSMVMVVDGRDSDETLAWGREMLRNLRPDCIPVNGDTSIYVDVVDNEIAYTPSLVKEDRPELLFMQNILANGGICGRRAFFGRFVLRAFGVPTTARSQPGHATLAHWHPDGWKTRLGGDWGPGNRGRHARMNRTRSSPYGVDLNFLASSQARLDANAFIKVKRAQWIGALMGEEPKLGLVTRDDNSDEESLSFWHELALHEQRRIIAEQDANRGAASSSMAAAPPAPAATGKITVDAAGVITIPSAATSSPTESTSNLSRGGAKDLLVFVKDHKADITRLHVSRYSSASDTFTYQFNAPKAGKYQLVATVATPRWDRRLNASANGGTAVEIPLPYTLGLWEKTEPVEVVLAAGRNELTFQGPARVTIDRFTLTPLR